MMKLKFKTTLLVSAMAMAGVAYMPQANAVVNVFSSTDSATLLSGPVSQGSFTTTWDFQVSDSFFAINATGNSIFNSNTGTGVKLTGFDLYDGSTLIQAGAFTSPGPKFYSTLLTYEPLLANHTYTLQISGIGANANPTKNTWSASVSFSPAVPEPEEWVMFLVGAGLVSYQVRRKQKSLSQSALG